MSAQGRPRGPYLTEGRVLELERQIAAVEARLDERIDGVRRELAEQSEVQLDLLRAIAGAAMEVLRRRLGLTTPVAHAGDEPRGRAA